MECLANQIDQNRFCTYWWQSSIAVNKYWIDWAFSKFTKIQRKQFVFLVENQLEKSMWNGNANTCHKIQTKIKQMHCFKTIDHDINVGSFISRYSNILAWFILPLYLSEVCSDHFWKWCISNFVAIAFLCFPRPKNHNNKCL